MASWLRICQSCRTSLALWLLRFFWSAVSSNPDKTSYFVEQETLPKLNSNIEPQETDSNLN